MTGFSTFTSQAARRRRPMVQVVAPRLLAALLAWSAVCCRPGTAFLTPSPQHAISHLSFNKDFSSKTSSSNVLPPVVPSRVVVSPRGRAKSSGHVLRHSSGAAVVQGASRTPAIQLFAAMLGTPLANMAGMGLSVIGGGALAGSLHTVTGPDHLAALLPRCVGRPWYQSMKIGAIWGLGHGLSAVIMGMVGFFLKDRVAHMGGFVSKLSLYTEVLIGLSLIVIGILGIKEARNFHVEPQSLSSAKSPNGKGSSGRAVFLNGLLHGFSWDGTPTLAPALAFNNWGPVMTFLLAYGAGTVVSMSTATSLIGESTSRVGQALDKPSIPRNLSIGSSILAIIIGIFWSYKAFF